MTCNVRSRLCDGLVSRSKYGETSRKAGSFRGLAHVYVLIVKPCSSRNMEVLVV
jgi:hypothetical protein